MQQYDLHSRNKRITKKNFKRRRVICGYPGHVIMGDLLTFPEGYRRFNYFQGKTYDYILLLVDCFSKKIWAKPLSKKSKEETSVALNSIFDSMLYKPTMFVTDEGTGKNFWFSVANYL